MALARACTECGRSLGDKDPSAVTCSNACRQKRRRRVARLNRQQDALATRGPVPAAVDQIVKDSRQAVTEVVANELGPIVREAIDESVLGAIRQLLALTPKAVAVLGEELEATTTRKVDGEEQVVPDTGRRSSAARTVMRYTVGHPALAPEKQVGGLTVNMGIPMQDAPEHVDAAPDDAEEMRTCDLCGEDKPVEAFVADSDRCGACFHDWRKAALEQFHTAAGE